MLASALLETLFIDTTAPTLRPVPPTSPVSELASASLWLFTSAVSDAPAIALEGATGSVYDVIVRSLAGEMSASGNDDVRGSGW